MIELAWLIAGLGIGLTGGATLLWWSERRARAREQAALEVQLAWLHAALRDLSRAHEALRDLVRRAEHDLTGGAKRPSPEQVAHAAHNLHQAAREAEIALERTRELRRALQASQRTLCGRAQVLHPERGLVPAEDLGLPGLLEPGLPSLSPSPSPSPSPSATPLSAADPGGDRGSERLSALTPEGPPRAKLAL